MSTPEPLRRRWDDPSIYRSSARAVRRNVEIALGTDGLAAAGAVRRLLQDDLPWLEQRAVHISRIERRSWKLIARRLGRSRQAVWSKFREVDGVPLPPPLAPTTDDDRLLARVNLGRAEARRRDEFERLGHRDVVAW